MGAISTFLIPENELLITLIAKGVVLLFSKEFVIMR